MRRTAVRLADGREIIYFDEDGAPERRAVDTRDLPPQQVNSEIRRDPLTGDWVVIAAHRQTRTYRPPADICPLCPSAPGRRTEIPESSYHVVVFENRFPSLSPTAGPVHGGLVGPNRVELSTFAPGRGRCEVVCFTADHHSSFAGLSVSRVRTVLDAWADRTQYMSSVDRVAQVFPFENRGEEVGVTLSHPHGQIYGYPFVTPRTERMLTVARSYLAEHGRPLVGDVLAAELADGSRVLRSTGHWTAFVPAAARWPVEVRLVPHRQVPDLPALTAEERDDFAVLYLDVLGRLDALYQRPLPYVAAWHQAPVRRDRDLSWLHLEVFSVLRTPDKLKYLAGSESGLAVWINDVAPEALADRLRAVDPGLRDAGGRFSPGPVVEQSGT